MSINKKFCAYCGSILKQSNICNTCGQSNAISNKAQSDKSFKKVAKKKRKNFQRYDKCAEFDDED